MVFLMNFQRPKARHTTPHPFTEQRVLLFCSVLFLTHSPSQVPVSSQPVSLSSKHGLALPTYPHIENTTLVQGSDVK